MRVCVCARARSFGDLRKAGVTVGKVGATVVDPENICLMKDTVRRSVTILFPEDRNVHNKVGC